MTVIAHFHFRNIQVHHLRNLRRFFRRTRKMEVPRKFLLSRMKTTLGYSYIVTKKYQKFWLFVTLYQPERKDTLLPLQTHVLDKMRSSTDPMLRCIVQLILTVVNEKKIENSTRAHFFVTSTKLWDTEIITPSLFQFLSLFEITQTSSRKSDSFWCMKISFFTLGVWFFGPYGTADFFELKELGKEKSY